MSTVLTFDPMRSNKIRSDTVTNVFASKVADAFFSFSPLDVFKG